MGKLVIKNRREVERAKRRRQQMKGEFRGRRRDKVERMRVKERGEIQKRNKWGVNPSGGKEMKTRRKKTSRKLKKTCKERKNITSREAMKKRIWSQSQRDGRVRKGTKRRREKESRKGDRK